MGEKRNVYRLLVGKPEGKRPLGRPRCRLIENIKMDRFRQFPRANVRGALKPMNMNAY
jgi:hypothetical protein